jgi:SAM-dependent methyltransferase
MTVSTRLVAPEQGNAAATHNTSPYDSGEVVSAYRARNWGTKKYYFNKMEMSVLNGIGLDNEIVLDIGVGVGQKALALAPRSRMVVGGDLSHAMLTGAQRECAGNPKIALLRCNASQLPFVPATFGLIVCYGLLEATQDFAPFLSEFVRVSKPGSHLVITCPNADAWHRATWSKLKKIHHSLDSLKATLSAGGYKLIEHQTIFYLPARYLLWGPSIVLSLVGLDRALARAVVAVERCLSKSASLGGKGSTHLLLAQRA